MARYTGSNCFIKEKGKPWICKLKRCGLPYSDHVKRDCGRKIKKMKLVTKTDKNGKPVKDKKGQVVKEKVEVITHCGKHYYRCNGKICSHCSGCLKVNNKAGEE